MEQIDEKVLFKSEGRPEKRTKMLKLCSEIVTVCGVVIVACAKFIGGGADKLSLIGFGAIVFGILFFVYQNSFDRMGTEARLYLYDNHIEGVQVSPVKQFSLCYSEIKEVNKMSAMGNDMIMIKTGTDFYTVLTNELDTAYQIICNKVYGEE